MKNRLLIPIICIILFFSIITMLLAYPQFEANQENNLKWAVGEYDGTLSDRSMMIIEQCKDQEQNPFKDYALLRYSNGHYYIDNVICELINVEKGGCLEPQYNEDSEVIGCYNHISYDFPYGETRMEFNEEFCNQLNTTYPLVQEDKDSLYNQYQYICKERGLLDEDDIEIDYEDKFEKLPYGAYHINGSDGSYTLIEINCFVGQIQKGNECVSILDEDSESLNKKWGELYIEAQILKESLYTDSTNMTTIERMFEIDNETMRIATILSERGFTIDVPDYKHTQRIQLSELRVSPIISDVTPEMWNENQKRAEERNVIRLEQLEKLNKDADFVKATKIIQELNSTNIEDDAYWQTVLDSLILITEKQGISLNGTLSFEDSEMLRELIRQEKENEN